MKTITTHATAALTVSERIWFSSIEIEAINNVPGSDPDLLRTIAVELRYAARHAEKGQEHQYRNQLALAEDLCDSVQNEVYRRKAKSQIIALRSM